MSRVSKTATVVLAAALCSVVIVAPALAKTEHMTGGKATVAESSAIVAFLHALGITVTPIGPTNVSGSSLSMPMTSGTLAVPSMDGVMHTKGGFLFSKGHRHLRVTDYRLTHVGHVATLSAVVHGKRIVLARMVSPKVSMPGKAGTMSGTLKMTAVWAHLINHLIGKHVVHAGEALGDLTAKVKVS